MNRVEVCNTCGSENGENRMSCPECRLINHRILARAKKLNRRATDVEANALTSAFLAGKFSGVSA